jgi:hypothetical protein
VWTGWRGTIRIVQPATVIRWHRRAFALHWRWRSRRSRVGRPAIAPDIRGLIRQMRQANPLWGAPRIHGRCVLMYSTANAASCGLLSPIASASTRALSIGQPS